MDAETVSTKLTTISKKFEAYFDKLYPQFDTPLKSYTSSDTPLRSPTSSDTP